MLCAFYCKEKTLELEKSIDNVTANNCHTSLENESDLRWSRHADISTFLLVSWLCLSIFSYGYGKNLRSGFLIQIFGSPIMIIMITSLALDGGKSRTAKICRHALPQFLGKISMSLYLIHFPIIKYFCSFNTNIDNWPNFDHEQQPSWGIFIVVPISLLAAYILERFIEVPCQRFLRTKKKIY